jgi:DNA polymerase III delta prime subunit
MNEKLSEEIIDSFNKKTFIKEWLSHKYKEKSLALYGLPGTGKTTIADYILKDWVKVYIKSDFCKVSKNFEDYLNDTLYKKSITMMFNEKIYKSLIIDDIYYIQINDKKLFKSIIQFSKQKYKNNPIIYIFNSINKNVKIIINKCYPFKIEYTTNFLTSIVEKYFLNDFDKKDIFELVSKSNRNLHNIKVNIHFYKDNFSKINIYDNINEELSDHINNIIRMKNIDDIYKNSYSDYMVIGMNLLDSIPDFLKSNKTLSKSEKINLIYETYKNNSIADSIYRILNETNDWNSINHILTFNTLSTVYHLQKNKLSLEKIPYTKYISKSIIFIHKNKVLNTNIENIEYLYELIEKYLTKNEKIIFNKIKSYILYFNIDMTVAETFLKYFKNYNKDKIKIFY